MLLVAGLVGSGEARQAKTLAEIKASKAVTVCADPDNLAVGLKLDLPKNVIHRKPLK